MIVWMCARALLCLSLGVYVYELSLPRSILITSLFLSFSITKLRGWSCVASAFIHTYTYISECSPYTCAYYNNARDVFHCAVCLRTTAHQQQHQHQYTHTLTHKRTLSSQSFITSISHQFRALFSLFPIIVIIIGSRTFFHWHCCIYAFAFRVLRPQYRVWAHTLIQYGHKDKFPLILIIVFIFSFVVFTRLLSHTNTQSPHSHIHLYIYRSI